MGASRASRRAARRSGIFAPANPRTAGTLFSAAPRPGLRQPFGEWIPMVATRACSRVVLTIKAPTIRAGCRNTRRCPDLSLFVVGLDFQKVEGLFLTEGVTRFLRARPIQNSQLRCRVFG